MKRNPLNRHLRAVAMMEMCFALPFLFLVISLVFYFGRGLTRVQNAQIMDRYEAWRLAGGGPGPDGRTQYMNEAFFARKATSLEHTVTTYFPPDAGNDLIAATAGFSGDTQNLVTLALGQFPTGQTVQFTTTFDSSIRLWKNFERPVVHGHTVLDNDWKFATAWVKPKDQWVQAFRANDPWMLLPVRDQFFMDLDNSLTNLVTQGNGLAQFLQSLYTERPNYVGPTIELPQ